MNRSKQFRSIRSPRLVVAVAALAALYGVSKGAVERSEQQPAVSSSVVAAQTVTLTAPHAEPVATPRNTIVQCQALGPAAPCPICAVDCSNCDCCRELGWDAMRPIPFQAYGQGEYVGHARIEHIPEYRIRVDDQLEFNYRLTREETSHPYQLNVGDELRIESVIDPQLDRTLVVQPDGTITPRLLGQVRATHHTVSQLRDELENSYTEFYKQQKEKKSASLSVTPIKVNTKLEDLRAAVDNRGGSGGQNRSAKVSPDGTVSLPAIGTFRVQGLTLPELKREVDERYAAIVEGMDVTPVLTQRAPRYVFVVGEVHLPGRFTLEGPTTVMQALAMAGSWNVGAHIKQIVIFRRGDDWRLLATMVDLSGALRGKEPCPPGEIWVNDSDLIIVPKSPILETDDFIDLVFTRGIYGVFPFSSQLGFGRLGALSP